MAAAKRMLLYEDLLGFIKLYTCVAINPKGLIRLYGYHHALSGKKGILNITFPCH